MPGIIDELFSGLTTIKEEEALPAAETHEDEGGAPHEEQPKAPHEERSILFPMGDDFKQFMKERGQA